MEKKFIKPMTNKELAAVYQVSNSTFKRWILPFNEQIGKKEGWFYKPVQVKKSSSCSAIPINRDYRYDKRAFLSQRHKDRSFGYTKNINPCVFAGESFEASDLC